MPPLHEAELKETITTYPLLGVGQFGNQLHGAGTEIRARWVERQRQVTLPDSSVIDLIADVAVDRELKIGDLLFRGLLSSYVDGTGTADNELCEVRLKNIVPDVKGRNTRYSVSVSRYMQKPNSQ